MATLTVTGAIRRIFFEGKGATIVERYTGRDNQTFEREYTAWFHEPTDLQLGDIVTLQGRHSAVKELWTNADGSPKLNNQGVQGESIKVSLNDTEVIQRVETANAKTMPAPADDMPF